MDPHRIFLRAWTLANEQVMDPTGIANASGTVLYIGDGSRRAAPSGASSGEAQFVDGPGTSPQVFVNSDLDPAALAPMDELLAVPVPNGPATWSSDDPLESGFCPVLLHELAHALNMMTGTEDLRSLAPGRPTEAEIEASTWENRYRMHHPPYTLRTTANGRPLPEDAIYPDD
jgi:hypothetical protein